MAGDAFDLDKILSGQLTPMFFGSASNNFGVEPFLKQLPLLYQVAHSPRVADVGVIQPDGREVHRLHLQDSGQHEPRPPRPAGLHARVLRRVRKGHDRVAFLLGRQDQAGAAAAVHGAGARDAWKPAYPGRHHRPVRPGHFPPGRYAVHRRARALFGHSRCSRRSSSAASAPRIP